MIPGLVSLGERVTVRNHVEVGRDAYNIPVTEPHDEVVVGVLVQPATESMVLDRETETRVVYALHFPKTWNKPLKGCDVFVRGEWFRVVNDPRPHAWSPTAFNYTVRVARIDG